MQFSVEHWYDDGIGTEGSADSGLSSDQAWIHFAGIFNMLREQDERLFLFRRERPGRSREVVAQAWIDQLGELQLRVARGYAPAVSLGRYQSV